MHVFLHIKSNRKRKMARVLEAEKKIAAMMTTTATTTTKTSVFEIGGLEVKCKQIDTSPKPVLIFRPSGVRGTYPVIMFLHGFNLRNNFYSQLLQHISSHGYIVVAPQLYFIIPPNGENEVKCAAEIANWITTDLQANLPKKIEADLTKLALAGHSRGGRAAFALLLGKPKTTIPTFSVLLGIDPVSGQSKKNQVEPPILTYIPQSFDLKIPVNVIGTGLGPEKKNFLFPPCAPDGVNHKEFFNESKPPCYHFVTTDYGHMDMLDDDMTDIVGAISGCMCKNGNGKKDPMRKSVGGITVAFLKAYLDGEKEDLDDIVKQPDIAPVKLDPVTYIEA